MSGSARKKIPSPIAERAEEKDVEMEVGTIILIILFLTKYKYICIC